MAQTRGYVQKTDLTPEEQLEVAFFHLRRGISQQDLANIYGGINSARVNDAVDKARMAFKITDGRAGREPG
jgi:hypothetical protein